MGEARTAGAIRAEIKVLLVKCIVVELQGGSRGSPGMILVDLLNLCALIKYGKR
jgi:hypothetical protein